MRLQKAGSHRRITVNTLSMQQAAEVGGGNPIIGAIVVAAVATWVWSNRGALQEIAQSAVETTVDLNAECGD